MCRPLPEAMDSTVITTPTISVAMLISIMVRVPAFRSITTARPAEPVNTNTGSPPHTTEVECTRVRVRAGPSAPYRPFSAHTANITGAAIATDARADLGSLNSGTMRASAPGLRLTVSFRGRTASACKTKTPSSTI